MTGIDPDAPPVCPHGHGEMTPPVNGDPLEPDAPWCETCGHIHGRECAGNCWYGDQPPDTLLGTLKQRVLRWFQ